MDTSGLFHEFFRNKTILVTGHTGFKGSWLSLWLRELGANVVGYSLQPPSQPNLFERCGLDKKIRSTFGDIRDLNHLRDVISETKPHVVFHLAAQPLVRTSYLTPVETFSTNVIGTVHVLEAVRQAGSSVRVCQTVTSDKCYENLETEHTYAETDSMGGRDPYSASKGAAELTIAAYRCSFFPPQMIHEHGVSLSSVRAGNVLGGGDWGEGRLLPDCVRALSKNQSIEIRNPTAVRPWQYVLDALSGNLHLAEQQASGSAIYADGWNFGPDVTEGLRVADLTEKVIQHWGSGNWFHANGNNVSERNSFREAKLLRLDCSKANRLLNWRPVFNSEECIAETVRWYKLAYQDTNFDAFTYTMDCIKKYIKAAKERGAPWAIQQKAFR